MGRDVPRLDAHAATLRERHGVRVETFACDVADEIEVDGAFAASRERLGDAQVLVNNAGQAESAAFTVTPDFAVSSASARVRPITPCLAAQYAAVFGYPRSPAVEAMVTMRPARAASMAGSTWREHR